MEIDRDRIMAGVRELKHYFEGQRPLPADAPRLAEDIERYILDLETRNHELRSMFDNIVGKYLKMTDKDREEERAEGKGP